MTQTEPTTETEADANPPKDAETIVMRGVKHFAERVVFERRRRLADRLVAALYAAYHYQPSQKTAICLTRDRVVLVAVRMTNEKEDE